MIPNFESYFFENSINSLHCIKVTAKGFSIIILIFFFSACFPKLFGVYDQRKVFSNLYLFVTAPASNFKATTIVVPVHADGDYVQEILPGPAENFPSDIEVVAVPPEEANRIIKKVEELQKAKTEKKKYIRQNESPVMDAELKPAKALNDSIIFAQKSPGLLIQNSKKILADEFPNLSKKFINFLFNNMDRQTRFEIMSDPSKYLNDELAKLDELLSADTFSTSNLTPRQLIKFNYLMDIKFADELANAGLPQDSTKIIFLNSKVDLVDLLKKQSMQKI